MISIREIDHLVLRVMDLDRMLRFYCDVLGCTVERRRDEIGLIQLRAGRSIIDLVPVDGALGQAGGAAPAKEARNLDHFCLRVEPFDEHGIRHHLEYLRLAYGIGQDADIAIFVESFVLSPLARQGTVGLIVDSAHARVVE